MKIGNLKILLLLLMLHRLLLAQSNSAPYVVKHSEEFQSPKGYTVLTPLGYGKDGIIQVNAKGVKLFSLQKFSPDLVLEKENRVSLSERVSDDAVYERMIKTKEKTYLLMRDVNKAEQKEGVKAIEFFPDKLDFAEKTISLFESSGKVKLPLYTGLGTVLFEDVNNPKRYAFVLSEDQTKLMCNYTLVPKENNTKVNKDVIGMYVFNENMEKLWGAEYKMPYTEAMMDNLGFTLSDNGKIYLLIKVFGKEDRIASIKNKDIANYHYEVLVYQKDNPEAKAIEIKLDNYFPKEAYIYEDLNHNIVIAGFYSGSSDAGISGAYMVKLDVDKQTVSRMNGGTYEIPSSVIKAYASDWEKRRLDKKERKGQHAGIHDLKIRNISTTPNGSVKIIAEQYVTYGHYEYNRMPGPAGYGYYGYNNYNMSNSRPVYNTLADDIFVLSIDSNGKLEWVRKLPKAQHGNTKDGAGLSLVSSFNGNDVTIFYLDNSKNEKLPESEPPYTLEEYNYGYLTGVRIDAFGNVSKYNLGYTKNYKTNFYIRYFVEGGNNNLISTERRKRKNVLFSIETK